MALLSFLQATFGLLLALGLIGLGGALVMLGGPAGVIAGGLGLGIGVMKLAAPVFHLAFAFGAFKLRKWAWWVGLAGPALSLSGAVYDIGVQRVPAGSSLIGAAIPALMLAYLLSPGVRKAFQN